MSFLSLPLGEQPCRSMCYTVMDCRVESRMDCCDDCTPRQWGSLRIGVDIAVMAWPPKVGKTVWILDNSSMLRERCPKCSLAHHVLCSIP